MTYMRKKQNKGKHIEQLIKRQMDTKNQETCLEFGNKLRTSGKNKSYSGIQELHGANKNTVISTDGLKHIINQYVTSEFRTNEENKIDIAAQVKQIERNNPISNDINDTLKKNQFGLRDTL